VSVDPIGAISDHDVTPDEPGQAQRQLRPGTAFGSAIVAPARCHRSPAVPDPTDAIPAATAVDLAAGRERCGRGVEDRAGPAMRDRRRGGWHNRAD
jgi:hypothetical protein